MQPNEPIPLPLAALERIDDACTHFEQLWRSGRPPDLRSFLAGAGAERRTLFRELLKVELEYRLKRGEQPAAEDYRQRFAEECGAAVFASIHREQGPGDDPGPGQSVSLGASGLAPAAMMVPTPPPSGTLARYRIERILGQGAFGVVYLAEDQELHRFVALKVAHEARLVQGDIDAFLVEARVLASLDHPAIIPVYDVGRADGCSFIVTKLIEGSNLSERLRQGLPAYRQAAQWLATIAHALQAAHEKGLVHRDVKPSNILIDAAGRAYIGDFGLALSEEHFGKGPRLLGTPAYMSPEQARGEGHRVSARSDVFSLGAVLYATLTGRPPFQAESLTKTLKQVVEHEPVAPVRLNPTVGRDLDTICLKCLEKQPEKRYASAGALAEDLQRFLDNRPILARPAGPVEKLVRWSRRNPTVAALAAGIVVVLVTAFVLVSWSYIRAEYAFQEEARQKQEARAAEQRADRARTVAVEEAGVAREIAGFLGGLFEQADPFVPTGRVFGEQPIINPSAMDIVNRGARQLANADLFKEKPLVRATLLDKVGHIYLSLGEGAKAAPFVIEALELRRKHLPADHADLASSLHNVGFLHLVKGNMKKSSELFAAALDMRGRLFGTRSPQAMASRYHLAIARVALHDPSAEQLLLEAIDFQRARLKAAEQRHPESVGQEALELSFSLLSLCNFHAQRSQVLKALPYLLEAKQVSEKLSNKDLAGLARNFISYRRCQAFGQVDQADKELGQALAVIQKYTSTHHFLHLALQKERAYLYFENGRYREAEKAFVDLEAHCRKATGDDGLALADLSYEIARSIARGALVQAEQAKDMRQLRTQAARVEQYARAAYLQGMHNGAEKERMGVYAVFLAYTLLFVRPEPDNAAGEEIAREGVKIRSDYYGVGHGLTSHPRAFLFLALARQNKVEAIEKTMLDLLARTPRPRWDQNAALSLPEAARKVALAGKIKTALLILEQAARAGHYQMDKARSDPAFAALCKTDEYRQLLKSLSK